MAAGDTVSELDKTQALVLYLNTGQVDTNGKPIIDHVTVGGINTAAAEQDKYDFAYTLSALTSKTVEGIDIREVTSLGPIS